LQVYQADNLTVTTTKPKYDEAKNEVFIYIAKFRMYSLIWSLLALCGLSAIIYDLAVSNSSAPMLIQLALVMVGTQEVNGALTTPILNMLVTVVFTI
jgi:hypothetical protein